jgi:ABC-type multidrug transport system fused ATPase/permease subunit
MTALTRDLDIFEFGDATEIGEKGITLSGGQKQRVSIARAVYSQANILILDDCLSAVDAHTAKHLYDYCLMGPLMKDRTVILVTHYVRLCMDGASYIVALKDGQVHGAGSPKSVLKSGALGEELSRTKDKEDENEGSDGPIPTVPKVVADRPDQKEGDGKLVDDETRAEGGITWSVYKTYVEATGGNLFWGTVFGLFALAQTGGLYQEYWIKIWSAAYNDPTKTVDAAYYLAVYFLIGLIVMGFISARSYALFTGSIRASKTLHDRMLGSILRSTVRFFDTTPMGRIVNRFSSDLSTIDGAATLTSFFLYSVVAAISVIVLICFITPVFLLPGTVIAYLFYAIGTYYLYTSRDLKRLNSVSRSPIYVQASEATNGVVTIRAFGSQERFLKENYDKIDDNNRPFLWLWATTCWLNARSEIIGASVGFCAGIVLVLARHRVDAGMAGLSLLQCLSFTHNVLWVVRNYSVTEMNMNSVERVSEYLHIEEEPPAHVPETEPDTYWPETGNIEVNNLVVKYSPEQPAVLRNVSFKVQPKEKIGIVGRTGSGKTTLALSIFRFMEPTSGSIHIDGVDIHTLGLHDLRSRLTIIPQDPVLFSGTLRTNLDPFDEYTDAELWLALKRSHLIDDSQEALFDDNRITLESPVTENGANWSQGQRQLIALARALVKRTRLIILDEATSSIGKLERIYLT